MPRRNESIGELLFKSPWWVSVVLGVIVFASLYWGLPLWAGNDNLRQNFIKPFVGVAPGVLFVAMVFAAGSFWFTRFRRSLVDMQTSLETLRALSWKQFEFMVAEAFRRQGFAVEFSMNRGADSGVDLALQKDGSKTLVQCKQWKAQAVSVSVAREMFGLMHAESAQAVIIVTTGNFTHDAQAFAAGKPIQLINGSELLALVRSVQTSPAADAATPAEPIPTETIPACPSCGQVMVLRTSRRGSNAGNQFWGCSTYPACKGTRSF